MDRNAIMPTEQVRNEFEELVKRIQSYDGSTGHLEKEWREDQQRLFCLLGKYPLDIYQLRDETKNNVKKIVDGYLIWSFNAYW